MTENNSIQKKDENSSPIIKHIDGLNIDIVNKSNCKLCQSKFRLEAEAEYEKSNNMRFVHTLLKSKGDDMCYHSVRGHLLNHYKKQEKAMILKEYADNLKEWLSTGGTRKSALLERIAMFSREMAIIAAETEGLSLESRIKSLEALKKAGDTVTALEDKIDEIDKDMEPVFIIVNEFQNIISKKIKQTQSQEVKGVLASLLEELKEKLGELDIERKA